MSTATTATIDSRTSLDSQASCTPSAASDSHDAASKENELTAHNFWTLFHPNHSGISQYTNMHKTMTLDPDKSKDLKILLAGAASDAAMDNSAIYSVVSYEQGEGPGDFKYSVWHEDYQYLFLEKKDLEDFAASRTGSLVYFDTKEALPDQRPSYYVPQEEYDRMMNTPSHELRGWVGVAATWYCESQRENQLRANLPVINPTTRESLRANATADGSDAGQSVDTATDTVTVESLLDEIFGKATPETLEDMRDKLPDDGTRRHSIDSSTTLDSRFSDAPTERPGTPQSSDSAYSGGLKPSRHDWEPAPSAETRSSKRGSRSLCCIPRRTDDSDCDLPPRRVPWNK